MWDVINFVRIRASLYPGEFLQFTIGRMGFPSLWPIIRPLIFGAVWLRLKEFSFFLVWYRYT